jgi:hypothetical protein
MNLTTDQVEFLRKCHPQICIPCYGGQLFESVFVSMLKFVIYANKIGLNFSIDTMVNESLITRGRNNLVAKMMENAQSTHLLFIDADIGFQPENIFQLLLHDKDVVGGLYPKKSLPIDYVVNIDPQHVGPNGEIQLVNGLIPLTRLGTGFMMIKRGALQRMFEAYPETKYIGNIGLDKKYDPFMYALFDTIITKDLEYNSEDWTFCDRWRAIGGEIWGDISIKLDHTGHFRYPGDPDRLSKMLGTPQKASISQSAGDIESVRRSAPAAMPPVDPNAVPQTAKRSLADFKKVTEENK